MQIVCSLKAYENVLEGWKRLIVNISEALAFVSVGHGIAGKFYYYCVLVSIIITMAWAGDADVFQNAEQGQHLSAGNTKFAFDLYQRQTLPEDDNIIFSPFSIYTALAMTYLGARGQTKSQMRDVLHFDDVEEEHLHQAFSDILSALNKSEQAYKLYTANQLFGEKTYSFLDEFLANGLKYYAAELAPVDFR